MRPSASTTSAHVTPRTSRALLHEPPSSISSRPMNDDDEAPTIATCRTRAFSALLAASRDRFVRAAISRKNALSSGHVGLAAS